MADFRRWISALILLALFHWAASAQDNRKPPKNPCSQPSKVYWQKLKDSELKWICASDGKWKTYEDSGVVNPITPGDQPGSNLTAIVPGSSSPLPADPNMPVISAEEMARIGVPAFDAPDPIIVFHRIQPEQVEDLQPELECRFAIQSASWAEARYFGGWRRNCEEIPFLLRHFNDLFRSLVPLMFPDAPTPKDDEKLSLWGEVRVPIPVK